jgi:hypothetical protein
MHSVMIASHWILSLSLALCSLISRPRISSGVVSHLWWRLTGVKISHGDYRVDMGSVTAGSWLMSKGTSTVV